MKKIKVNLTGSFLFLLLVFSQGNCTEMPAPEQEALTPHLDGWTIERKELGIDVHPTALLFTSSSEGYIIGNNGAIFHTIDSGNSWISQNSTTTLHLNSIHFLNENTGFISGKGMNCLSPDCNKGSILLRTTDGGNNWTKIFYDSLAYLESMQFRDEKNGVAIMQTAQKPNSKWKFLVKTSDGGNTWTKMNYDIPQTYSTQIIKKENTYYTIGDKNKILKSTDFGETWASIETPVIPSYNIYYLYFINKDIGFISDGIKAYKTANGGQSWSQVSDRLCRQEGIHFYDENEGFNFSSVAVYEGGDFPTFKGTYIYSTVDGGVTFTESELFTDFNPGITAYPGPGIGYSINFAYLHRFIRDK